MNIAGHVSRAMLSRYSQIRMDAKRKALEAIVKKNPCPSPPRKRSPPAPAHPVIRNSPSHARPLSRAGRYHHKLRAAAHTQHQHLSASKCEQVYNGVTA